MASLRHPFNGTYSSGYCHGFSPCSDGRLFIRHSFSVQNYNYFSTPPKNFTFFIEYLIWGEFVEYSSELPKQIPFIACYKATDTLSTACGKFRNEFFPYNGRMIDSQPICSCLRLQAYAIDDFSYIPFLREPLPNRSYSSGRQAGDCQPHRNDIRHRTSVSPF